MSRYIEVRSMDSVYDYPRYYETAFSFRDIVREANLFEVCFRRFAKTAVTSVLELGCGNAPHMNELLSRGYAYTGIDLNEHMLAYSRSRIKPGETATLIRADMADFTLDSPVQFAFINLGSLYVRSTEELIRHFESVGNAVESGGLYLLDWCVQFSSIGTGQESWEIERDGIFVKTTVSGRYVDPVEQLFEETVSLEVDDRGEHKTIVPTETKREIHPQEFLLLLEYKTAFEFVGWWNDWDFDQPLSSTCKINRPIVLARRL